ncbi:unnamed protein product [Diamesa tonsa]
MAEQYVYQKERREFGKQCLFSDKKFLMVSLPSNHDDFNGFMLRNPVSEGTQLGKQYALSEVNTESTTVEHKGVLHQEGGWPKDVNCEDAEQTVRYRRKLEKDDTFITQVTKLGERMENCILQNNAVDIYDSYFEKLDPAPIVDRSHSRTMFVYKDAELPSRPVSHLSWSPDGGTKLAITYCNTDFQKNTPNLSMNSYIWETENPNQPLYKLCPSSSSICVEYNPKDPNVLVSGQYNGQCNTWDTRAGSRPVSNTPKEVCHRECVNSVLWINSKTATEFFSGGADGQVIWWDTRKLNERLDMLLMDPVKCDDQVRERSYGVSVLEYETTIPTRFMVGTEQGLLFSCNRKGKTPMEKIPQRMQCHASPIYTLARNPAFFKNFITVGDWNARIWSEDCKESSVIWTKFSPVELTDGCWSPTKCSLFYLGRTDGNLEAWDLLQQQSEPILTIKVCDNSIKCVKPHETGRMIACGSSNGNVYLVEVSENMTHSAKNDKAILTAMLDRESKREKILEGKLREIKIKMKTQVKTQEEPHEAPLIETADNDFFGNVEEETHRRLKEMENEENLAKEHIGDNQIKSNEDEDELEKQTNGIDLQKSVDDVTKETDKESLDDQ